MFKNIIMSKTSYVMRLFQISRFQGKVCFPADYWCHFILFENKNINFTEYFIYDLRKNLKHANRKYLYDSNNKLKLKWK